MNRFCKGLLGAGLVLTALFAWFVHADAAAYQAHIADILAACHLDSAQELQGARFALVLLRAVEFLIPAVIFIACALILTYHEQAIPHQKGEFRRIFLPFPPFRSH